MALRGTLDDISIVDLIQYPFSGKRTGEMVIVGSDDEARLYYRKGALIHGDYDGETGVEVLVKLLDWQQGEFEFRGGVKPSKSTIKGDLHHVVMQALKIRDDRKSAEDRKQAEQEELSKLQKQYGATDSTDLALLKRVVKFVNDDQMVIYVGMVDKDGKPLAEAGKKGEKPADSDALRESLTTLGRSYPRQPVGRICIEDQSGVVVMLTVGKSLLYAVGKSGAPMGAISRVVTKFAESI